MCLKRKDVERFNKLLQLLAQKKTITKQDYSFLKDNYYPVTMIDKEYVLS